jgi:hypothetical protein
MTVPPWAAPRGLRHAMASQMRNAAAASAVSGLRFDGAATPRRPQCWQADPDEVEKYWVKKEVADSWPEEVRKKFYNNAYQVKPGIYSGACGGCGWAARGHRRCALVGSCV